MGTEVAITATPGSGWQFESWTGGVADPDLATTTVTMDSTKTVTATFKEGTLDDYTLTMAVTGTGSTTPAVGEHTYPVGTEVAITATPETGWLFTSWTSEVANPYAASTTVTVNTNKTITAKFYKDSNGNGIPDDQEVGSDVDLNKDGIYDRDQPGTIKSVNTVVGDGQIGVTRGTNVDSIEWIESIDPDTILDATNRPDTLPLGLISFKLTVSTPGDNAQVTVYLSETASDAKWYKYDRLNGWQDYSAHAIFNADGKSVTLEFKDGGYGDADGAANGIIVDPSGLDSTAGNDGGGDDSGGGSCFIGTALGSAPESHGQMRGLPVVLLIGLVAGGCMTLRRSKTRKSG